MWRSALLLAALTSGTAQQQQFDLICNGTMHTIRVTLAPQEPDSSYSHHYRVDLKAGKWCEADCSAIRPITEIQPGFLQLQEQSKERGLLGNPGNFSSSIDRTTGEEHMMTEETDDLLGKSLTTWDGKCEPASFSGFPKIETKF